MNIEQKLTAVILTLTFGLSSWAQVAKVEVVSPERATVRRMVEQPGQVEAYETAPLHAKVAGYVSEVRVDIGDRVKKGDVLAVIDLPEADAELRRRESMLGSAEADLRQAEAMLHVAESRLVSAETKTTEARAGMRRADADLVRWDAELARVAQLVRESALTGGLLDETKSKQAAAAAARDEARARVTTAEAGLVEAKAGIDKAHADIGAAKARVNVAQFEVKKTQVDLAYTRIVAPFDGVITKRRVDPGHLTRIGADGPFLLMIAREDLVTISVGVPEVAAPFVDRGDVVKVRVQALDDRVMESKVARTSHVLDPTSRTLAVEIDLPTAETGIRPGMYVSVNIIAEEHGEAWTLPTTATFKESGKTYCKIVEGDKAISREIQTGIVDGGKVEVQKGLDGRERVVRANAASLSKDQTIQVLEPAKSGARP